MKAAADPESKVLQAVLGRRKQFETPEDRVIEAGELRDTCRPNSTVEWPGQDLINTPLLQAIRSQLPQNVELLLNSGANPDGIDMCSLESYQSLFLRFRPRIPDYVDIDGDVADRKTLLACMGLSQTAAITVEEIEDRTHYIAPFWTIHTSMAIDTFPGGDDMHSVVAAARLPSTQILNMLLKAGADASIWTLNSNRDHDPVCPMPSSLAVTSPLHAAIEANIPMVPHLLSLGFDPDFVPSSAPVACLTPLMSTFLITPEYQKPPQEAEMLEASSTFVLPTKFNLPAYTALVSHPSLKLTLITPMLSIHLFHLAVAHGSLPLFKHILSTFPISPASIAPTALGHNLLHIACLPISGANTKANSLAVMQSIHDTRSLVYPRVRPAPGFGLSTNQLSFNPPTKKHEVHQTEQTALIKFLVSTLPQNATEQDVYGNTALHYLASHTVPNADSISILCSVEGGEEAWNSVRNRWGHSAKDLFEGEDSEDEVREWREKYARELRAKERKRDEWWNMRLARERLVVNGGRGGARGGRGRGRGRGGCGKNSDAHDNEFPYHVRS
jgi:hypothetical protein